MYPSNVITKILLGGTIMVICPKCSQVSADGKELCAGCGVQFSTLETTPTQFSHPDWAKEPASKKASSDSPVNLV